MKNIWSSLTHLFRPTWKPQPKKEDVNAPFLFVVRFFFWLFIAALILLYATACATNHQPTPAPTSITLDYKFTDAEGQTIYWTYEERGFDCQLTCFYSLKSWYTLSDGHATLQHGDKFIPASDVESISETYLLSK